MPPRNLSGWRPSPPDSRDHVYSAPAPVLEALPPSADLSVPPVASPFEPAWDQGDLGSCGPHTACADVVHAALFRQKLPACPMPSRLFVYYATREVMGTVYEDSGVYNRAMLKAMNRYGWCDEAVWPYQIARFKERPPQAAFEQAAGRKIAEYLSVPQTLDQMRGCLAAGDPFIFGFNVYASMMTPSVASMGNVPMPKRGEKQIGGHDVLVVGYDDQSRRFKFKNSWGAGWGLNGYGTIPYDYAANPGMASDFWTVRHAALPVPTPPAPPTPPPGRKVRFITEVDLDTGAAVILTDRSADALAALRGHGADALLIYRATQVGISPATLLGWVIRYGQTALDCVADVIDVWRSGDWARLLDVAEKYGPKLAALVREVLAALKGAGQ